MNLARFMEIHFDRRWVLGHPKVDVGHRRQR
jgi:hypothetical protein